MIVVMAVSGSAIEKCTGGETGGLSFYNTQRSCIPASSEDVIATAIVGSMVMILLYFALKWTVTYIAYGKRKP